MQQDIISLNEKIAKESTLVRNLLSEIGKVIVGQNVMIERLLIGLFTNGHILLEAHRLEGLPREDLCSSRVDF